MISIPQRRLGAIRPRWSACAPKRISLAISLLVLLFIGLRSRHRVLSEQRPQAGDVGMFEDEKYSTVPPEGVMRFAGSDDEKHEHEQEKKAELNVLGFEKAFVVSMQERRDALTGFAIAANVTGFDFEVVSGMVEDGDDEEEAEEKEAVAEKLVRAGQSGKPGRDRGGKERATDAARKAWYRRSHINAARRMVAEGVESALVFEDDADWDVALKEQLELFAAGSNLLLNSQQKRVRDKGRKKTGSPYGDGWDMLWFGHCGIHPFSDDQRRFVIKNDYTVPPYVHRNTPEGVPETSLKRRIDESTRTLYRAASGACLYAYALSLKGASKIIYHLGVGAATLPMDIGYSRLCQFPVYDFKCVGVYPQLVDGFHESTNANRAHDDLISDGRKYSWNIEYSTRQNAGNLRAGKEVVNYWPDGKEIPEVSNVKTEFLEGFERRPPATPVDGVRRVPRPDPSYISYISTSIT